MSAAEIAIWVGAVMVIGSLVGTYLTFWYLAIRDGDSEGIGFMVAATFIIGAILWLCGATA